MAWRRKKRRGTSGWGQRSEAPTGYSYLGYVQWRASSAFRDACGLEDWLRRSVRTSELRWAAINEAVGFEYDRVALATADPADRWLVATARVYGLVLVTADEKILTSNAVRTLPNE